jgi:hypothetical protein
MSKSASITHSVASVVDVEVGSQSAQDLFKVFNFFS